jgi:putative membrane protein
MTFFRTATAAALVLSMAPFAYAQSAKMTPQEFAAMAASSDMLELESSKIALQQSQNADVKEFAQMMINDHTTASQNLKAAASKDGVTVPAEMLPKHAAEVQKLNGQTGAAFDAAYVKTQVAAHEEALNLMTSYSENGEGATKAHAEKTAPVIKMHYEHVQKIDKSM